LVLLVVSSSVALGASGRTVVTRVRSSVTTPGRYTVVAALRARGSASQAVKLQVPGQETRTIHAYKSRTVQAKYTLNLGQGSLSIRASTRGRAVALTVKLTRVGGQKVVPPTGSTSPGGTSTPPPPPPATITEPTTPPASSPYTNLLWSDDFVADYNAGMTEPNPAYWTFDTTWGGCGADTESTNTNSSANTQITPQGLAITALADGNGGYTSAQIDTGGNVSIPIGAYISASIAFPQGQGLCPAFWMLADQQATDTTPPGELDVVEAPSFVGSNLGSVAENPMFVAHGPVNGADSQLWIKGGTPKSWNPTQFNTYGLLWTGSAITWYVNNVALGSFSASDLPAGASWSSFAANFHLIFDLAVGGWPGPSSVSSASMFIQWVKVYA
jgi:beta-glucanase (GH16 family)